MAMNRNNKIVRRLICVPPLTFTSKDEKIADDIERWKDDQSLASILLQGNESASH